SIEIHYNTVVLHSASIEIHYNTVVLHSASIEIHYNTVVLHSASIEIHYNTVVLHSASIEIHYNTVVLHSASIEIHYNTVVLHSVLRALCFLKLDMFAEAKQDCDSALRLEPANKKAFYRRAMANKGLKDYLVSSSGHVCPCAPVRVYICVFVCLFDCVPIPRTTWPAALTCRRCCSRTPT
uniref:Uncharacterized protein n=1 Tax=Hucho hucho TaxID=62062 RepID=A0A4W5PUU3_9TELE